MASFNHVGLQEAIDALQLEAERIERNGPAALNAGGAVIAKVMKQTVPVRTGKLKQSIRATRVKRGVDGELSVEVYPQGKKKQVGEAQRFAEIGFVLEYGRSNMPARPWMEPARRMCEREAYDVMLNELMKD